MIPRPLLPRNRLAFALESMDERDERRRAPRCCGATGEWLVADGGPHWVCGCPISWVIADFQLVWTPRVLHQQACRARS